MAKRYLLAVSIGPVQDFIAAARKTRDLWYGSTLLSAISRTAATNVQRQGGELIFPHPEAVDSANAGAEIPVANIVLADFKDPTGSMADISSRVERAARLHLEQLQTRVLEEISDAVGAGLIDTDLLAQQVDEFLEFYTAWLPLESEDDYPETRLQLMRLLAGRKALRDFGRAPALATDARGRRKSMLDPSRESVLTSDEAHKDLPLRRWLKSESAEHLDGISLIKRVSSLDRASKAGRFASISRIAVDPLIRRIKEDDRQLPTGGGPFSASWE
ncbi:MAG: type III-B CRISPR-associated protein Cas10/Cmr2 [Thermomicrobiales bacterium]